MDFGFLDVFDGNLQIQKIKYLFNCYTENISPETGSQNFKFQRTTLIQELNKQVCKEKETICPSKIYLDLQITELIKFRPQSINPNLNGTTRRTSTSTYKMSQNLLNVKYWVDK